MKKGLFITMEGTDGCGKTTQLALLRQWLEKEGHNVLLLREPGGTSVGEKVREILLDAKNTGMSDITEMLLYAAARAQIVSEKIKPSLNEGKIVICDRFIDSSYVYQGFGRGIPLELVQTVNEAAMNSICPDITIFLDLSPDKALKRRISQSGADRIEMEAMDFHMKVYDGYKKLAEIFPDRIKTVDADQSIDLVAAEVRKLIENMIGG